MTLRMGELFAGYGGLGMGVADVLDVELAWVSEFDKGPSKVLAHRFPDVPNHGDITKIDWSAVEPVDVLTGGFPCQDVSAAGKRAGIRPGTRSGLWAQFAYAISQLRPRLVVIENVRGLLSARAHSPVEPCPWCVGDDPDGALRALGAVLGDLAGLGYDASWYGLRAADVGAPHGRFRVFVVAYPRDGAGHGEWARAESRQGGALAALATGWEDTPRGPRPFARLLPSPRTSDTNGAGQHGDGGLDLRTAVSLLGTPTARDHKGNGNGHGKSLHIEAARLLPTPMVGSTNPAAHGQISGDYRAKMDEALANWGQYAAAIHRWEQLTRPAPAPTETGPKGNPRLSARFSEFLMGLPAGWVTDVPGITRNEALKALGNGVVPQQCAAALRFLLGGTAPAPMPRVELLHTPDTASEAPNAGSNTRSKPAGLGNQVKALKNGGVA